MIINEFTLYVLIIRSLLSNKYCVEKDSLWNVHAPRKKKVYGPRRSPCTFSRLLSSSWNVIWSSTPCHMFYIVRLFFWKFEFITAFATSCGQFWVYNFKEIVKGRIVNFNKEYLYQIWFVLRCYLCNSCSIKTRTIHVNRQWYHMLEYIKTTRHNFEYKTI